MAYERATASGDPAAHAAVTSEARTSVRRISWGAVLAGVIIALTVNLLLSLLGVGIGASTIDPMQQGGTPSASTLGIGAGIWWLVSTLLALFAGAWVAGRLAGVPVKMDGMLHGLVTWGLATLLLIYLLSTAVSNLVGGAFGVVGSALQTAGQGAAAAGGAATQGGQGGPMGAIQQQVDQLIGRVTPQVQETTQQIQQATQDPNLRAVVEKIISAGPQGLTQQDREQAIQGLVANTDMTRPEAEQRLAQLEQAYLETAQTAREAGEATAEAISQAALWSFAALVLGAIVAAVGGMLGAPKVPTTSTTSTAYRRT